jgi:3-hydroxyanthranilate 3,4-dioxygenase
MHIRKPFVDTFAEASNYGPYDELPILPPDTDPQVHVSRNDRPQPFYLVCEKDSMLVQMTGEARIDLKHPEVRSYAMTTGDFVYIPAGTPHRILPKTTSMQHRYKARQPGLEGLAWYCENCGDEIAREVWDTAAELPQRAYLRITSTFNELPERRTCKSCGTVHPEVDIAGLRWEDIVRTLESA